MNLYPSSLFPNVHRMEKEHTVHSRIHTTLEETEGHLYRHGKEIDRTYLFLSRVKRATSYFLFLWTIPLQKKKKSITEVGSMLRSPISL